MAADSALLTSRRQFQIAGGVLALLVVAGAARWYFWNPSRKRLCRWRFAARWPSARAVKPVRSRPLSTYS